MPTKLTTEIFIERAKKVHGDKYDYSKSVYTGALDEIEIICPVHGSFLQIASSHTWGFDCKKCSVDKRTKYHTKEEKLKAYNEWRKRNYATKEGKKHVREYQSKYYNTAYWKNYKKKYNQTEKFKQYSKEYYKKNK